MNRSFILSVFAFVFAVISGVCAAAENSNSLALTNKAVDEFGQESVDRFEQMFQTGEFDFDYRGNGKATILHYAAFMGNLDRVKTLIQKGQV